MSGDGATATAAVLEKLLMAKKSIEMGRIEPDIAKATANLDGRCIYRIAGGQGDPAPGPHPLAALAGFLIRVRREQVEAFAAAPFGEPTVNILFDLHVRHMAGRGAAVSSLGIACAIPTSTAVRWIGQIVGAGQLVRWPDPADQRRRNITLAAYSTSAVKLTSAGGAAWQCKLSFEKTRPAYLTLQSLRRRRFACHVRRSPQGTYSIACPTSGRSIWQLPRLGGAPGCPGASRKSAHERQGDTSRSYCHCSIIDGPAIRDDVPRSQDLGISAIANIAAPPSDRNLRHRSKQHDYPSV